MPQNLQYFKLFGIYMSHTPKSWIKVVNMPKKITRKLPVIALLLLVLLFPSKNSSDTVIAVSADGYIKWVDFNVTAEILKTALACDLDSYEKSKTDPSVHHAELSVLVALCAAKYGGEFSRAKASDIKGFAERIMSGEKPEDISSSKHLNYFLEAYEAALGGFVGKYAVTENGILYERYGLKVFSPVAAGYYYNHYDDFGASRSYGYRRRHLGHDLLGSVGTPIVAIESGYVEAFGWNQYGGWRIGIRSYDGKRYYYYAHLRKGHPYNDIYEGKQVNAGEVIGYLGMTGYSSKEDVNNIDTPHLHYGIQLIFDKSQKDGVNQIWLDLYELTKFLAAHRSVVAYDKSSGDFNAVSPIIDLSAPD